MSKNKIKENDVTEKTYLREEDRQRCEIWTRVMGYHRPVSSFNIGKKGEYHERKFFSEESSKKHIS